MNNKKIIFMGTPKISSEYLSILIKNSYNIVSVFTQPPKKQNRGMKLKSSEVEIIAKKNNIKVHTPTNFDEEISNLISSYMPDLIIIMAYGLLIPDNIINYPKYGCINVHVSLLPRWRGASPIEYALLNGDKKTGVTIIRKLEIRAIALALRIPFFVFLKNNSLTNRKKLRIVNPNIKTGKITPANSMG